jgi:hypothetical protein
MGRLKPEDVFTPAAPAVDSIVYAQRRGLERQFQDTLNEQGAQVLVYGDSSIGKTSFVLTELRHKKTACVRVQCSSKMTWEKISNELLRELREGIIHREATEEALSPELPVNVFVAQAKLGGESSKQFQKIIGGDLGTVQHLTDILCEKEISLVIDDFEKARVGHTKVCVANLAKNLSDRSGRGKSARLIVVGISDNADDLIDADSSIASRLQTMKIARMNDEEMEEILNVGFKKLGIRGERSVISTLAGSFGGFPKYAHGIGLETSRAVFAAGNKELTMDSVKRGIGAFLRRYCRTAKARFDKATIVRCKPNQEYIMVVKGLSEIGARNEFTLDEAGLAIEDYMRKGSPSLTKAERNFGMDIEKLRTILNRLCRPERGSMFTRSKITGKYRYSDPLSPIFLNVGEYI